TWDAWGHYHAMLGLLLWHEESRDAQVLRCVESMAELFCRKFMGKPRRRLVDTGSTEMNMAPVHVLCILHRQTGKERYLDLALQWVDEFAALDADEQPLAGDYLNQALAGQPFFATPKPRWESLHPIMALAELYWITGEERYRQAFEQIWWSIVELDRHNNGGFSSGEAAQGNPYHQGAIETCCTIAWVAASVEMLKLTGSSIAADEIELSMLNSILGLHSASGRWVTYNTPMDGVRKASAHDIVFQAREGSPELNCCSVNGPRGLGMVSDWALMRDAEGLVLNWYGPSRMQVGLRRGLTVALTEETEYPRRGRVGIRVDPSQAAEFALKLRVPYWSQRTKVRVNGAVVRKVRAGTYLTLARYWQPGDIIDLELDMSMHYWQGERECCDKVSIFRGPVLLTYDRRLNAVDPDEVPALDAVGLRGNLVKAE
ncbi:MAG: glycoside hydrolase family 127 protein, partial [Gemmatimonadetes bacterium]|nr:glycoside hydrolase family 127 protein [Gemmatimonadota bacterium]